VVANHRRVYNVAGLGAGGGASGEAGGNQYRQGGQGDNFAQNSNLRLAICE
jgi:hypothetical protein